MCFQRMLEVNRATAVPDTRLVIRTAIAHARHKLALWLEDNGISEEDCLTLLVELLFHPAMNVVTASRPSANDDGITMMWQALKDSRHILLRCCGRRADLDTEDCLYGLVAILNDPELVKAGEFRPMIAYIQWGPAFERRRPTRAWSLRRAGL